MATKVKVILENIGAGKALNVDAPEGRRSIGNGEHEFTIEAGQTLRLAEADAPKEPDPREAENESADHEDDKAKGRNHRHTK